MAKIFVVDDSKELLELYHIILTNGGHTVKLNFSGDFFSEQATDFMPDLILLDVRLNRGDGREFCKTIKRDEVLKHIPVVLISASPDMLKNFKECGASATIEKPFNVSTVTSTVDQLLAKA